MDSIKYVITYVFNMLANTYINLGSVSFSCLSVIIGLGILSIIIWSVYALLGGD